MVFLASTPALPQWPTGNSAGYENSPGYTGTLTDGSGITVQSNTTYSFYSNLGNGSIGSNSVPVSNVTFIGCVWTGSGLNNFNALLYGTNLKFFYCTFQPAPLSSFPPSSKESPVPQASGFQYGLCADGTQASPGTFNTWCAGLTIRNCDFWGFGNAGARLANGSTQSAPFLVNYNYFHNVRVNTNGLDHNDGIGSPGGGGIDYMQLTNNSISASGNTNGVIWGSNGDEITNCLISGNLFGGFGYTVALHNDASQITGLTFTANTYSTLYLPAFGPLYDTTLLSSPGLTWKGNKWLVPAGAAWGHSAYNGYFWLPQSISNASPSTDELARGLVGTSDYM